MSRIGKQPVSIPKGVEVTIDNQTIVVKGKLGSLTRVIPDPIQVVRDGDHLMVSPREQGKGGKEHWALWGLTRALLSNMVKGVSDGFSKTMEVIGVGYRAAVEGRVLKLNLGFSHPVDFQLPDGIDAVVEKNTLIMIKGIDLERIGQTCAEIRAYRLPEPYKGKGVLYAGEKVKRKVGKKK
ncbi:MAG: 50S ribosomal protein L6 [Magnetococcales bacterium]|nr:50S ribosomal protein L6 [Magnetococcales bacterium]